MPRINYPLRCWLYRFYDRAKSTWLVSKLFYYGNSFKHFETIERIGTIAKCEHRPSTDGDINFDLVSSDLRWHCELTPCQPQELRAMVLSLELGERIRVSGTRTYDPDHRILWIKLKGGQNEIHPVLSIERV